MKIQNILYIVVIATLLAFACMKAAKANSNTYTGSDYDGTNYDLTVRRNYGQLQGELYNWNTGSYVDVQLKPRRIGGGLQGQGYDFGTGQFVDVDVDRWGNVNIDKY